MAAQCATADPDSRARALIVGGGIANFTDVAATFNGIIKAFREKQEQIKAAHMRIFVRRGGPNYKTGLQKMKELGAEIGVPIEVSRQAWAQGSRRNDSLERLLHCFA